MSNKPVVLLPFKLPTPDEQSWKPSKYLNEPEPPAPDLERMEQEAAAQSLGMDPRAIKKVKPRRTVDYGGGMGRLSLLRKTRPTRSFLPYMRPASTYVVDLLPPKAYLDNPSTSLCTKFVHTSMNKIRYPVNLVAWTPEARRVLTGSASGEFTLWNGLTFNFETILQAHESKIWALKFNHSGSFLISSDDTGVVKYFQPNMNNVAALAAHREAVRGLSFSPDDARFVSGGDDAKLKLWSFETMREERVFTGHGWDVKCVEWHPTKGLLASGSKDKLVKFWDPRTGQALSAIYSHKNTIQAIAWSINGDMLATASRDQTLRIFDIRAMKEFVCFKGHKQEVCSVAWHPIHPSLLVSGGSEGAILHWSLDSPTPTPRASIDQAHENNVWCLAYHPLGHILVSASSDFTTRFWCRERPADVGGEWKSGGEKPPEATGADEDEDYVPGLGFSTSMGLDGYGDGDYDNRDAPQGGRMGDNFIPGLGGPPVSSGRHDALPPHSDSSFSGGGSGSGRNGGGQWSGRGGRGGRGRRWGD